MLLADLGNTRAKFYRLDNHDVTFLANWNYQQNLAEILTPFAGQKLTFSSVTQPKRVELLLKTANSLKISTKQITTSAKDFGIENGYKYPEKLGIDRWLAMIGARQITQKSCLIIDAGTAITIDFLTADGAHQGGWIVAGLQTMQTALIQNTAALNLSGEPPQFTFAQNTQQAIANGALATAVGVIKQAINLAQKNTQEFEIFLTGGDAPLLAENLQTAHKVVADLVLQGLKLYAQDNQSETSSAN